MIIEKIVIKSFGLINDMTLEFSESVNVIEGQNEAGKSTIAAFIKYMLYGFSDSEREESVSERKKRISWTTGTAAGSMYVRVKGKRYLITRSTTPTDGSARTTYREEASIVDLETGAPAFGKLSAGSVFFGVDRELFENTAFIGSIGESAINEDSVKESIENILFSGSERINNQRAQAKIAGKMNALLHESGAGGAIVDLVSKEDELRAKLDGCNEDNRLILEKEAELHRIRSRREEAEDKESKLRDLDSCYSNVMLIQTFDQLHELEEECERRTAEYNAFVEENTAAGYVPDEQYLTDLAVARRSVDESYHTLGDAQTAYTEHKNAVGITREIEGAIAEADKLGGEAEIINRASAVAKTRALSIAGSVLSGLAVIAAAVAEIVIAGSGFLLWQILIGAGGVSALVGLGFSLHALKGSIDTLRGIESVFGTESFADLKGKLSVIAEARAKRDAMISATELARATVQRSRERYEEAKRNLVSLILKWGKEPPASELSGFLDNLSARAKAFIDRRAELYDAKTEIEITVREIRRTLADKSEIDVRAQVSPLKRKALAGINHDDIINGIAEYKARITEEDRLAFEVENELSLLKGRAGEPSEYYARIDAIESRRRELQDKHKAYYIALEAIKGASDNLRRGISPRLGEYATKMMEIMTDRKYSAFDVSDGLKVTYTDERGEEKSVDFLSGGTKVLAYVAVRAALIDMLYTEKPPVCFDESFAHQDNLRAASMMRGICRLAEEGCQSFIFTCRGREATLATRLIPGAGVYRLSVVEEEIN